MFSIVQETGEIKLAKTLDYEDTQSYILTVRASNEPPMTLNSETRVNINVLDVNDNAPVFTPNQITRLVPENEANWMVRTQA